METKELKEKLFYSKKNVFERRFSTVLLHSSLLLIPLPQGNGMPLPCGAAYISSGCSKVSLTRKIREMHQSAARPTTT